LPAHYTTVIGAMPVALGPLHGAPPSLTSALLALGGGIVGLAWLLVNLAIHRTSPKNWRTIVLFCVVLLFLTVGGVIQLFELGR
jgi:hypothetical protein